MLFNPYYNFSLLHYQFFFLFSFILQTIFLFLFFLLYCNTRKKSVVFIFSLVQSLIHVQLFATPWIAARQASLSVTNSQSLPKLMSVELVMPSNHLSLCRPLLLLPSVVPSHRVFPKVVAKTLELQLSVLPMNAQDWSPLGWTGWFSLQSKGL